MNRTSLTRSAAFATFLMGVALAQDGPAYVGTPGSLLNSAFCIKATTCASTGTIRLASGVTREFFTVRLRKPQRYGPPSYTVYVDRLPNKRKADSASLMYPFAQDTVEDGAFFKTFVSFMTGYDVSRAPKDVFLCELRIRGKATKFAVFTNQLSSGYASQTIVTVNDMGMDDGQLFSGVPASTRIVIGGDC